jgi:hypothetical protein
MTWKTYSLVATAILIFAATSRFACLGNWSFASDEIGTFLEVEAYRNPAASRITGKDNNVPKMIPLAMEIHDRGIRWFGNDERGSRTTMALFGIAQMIVLAIGLPKLFGQVATLSTLLLVTMWPEHLFYCQYHRFYAPVAFFTTSAMVLSAYRTWPTTIVAAICATAAFMTHTLGATAIGGLVAGAWLQYLFDRKSGMAIAIATTMYAIAAACYIYFVIVPLGIEKADDSHWAGLGLINGLKSGVSQASLPVLLLSVPGALLLWKSNRTQAAFWIVQVGVWAGCLLVLPIAIPFHTAYSFPLAIGLLITAGYALGTIVEAIWSRHKTAAIALAIGIALLNLPAMASHYVDGSRHDFRSAADWIHDRLQPGDSLGTLQGDKFEYYQPSLTGRWTRIPPKDFDAWAATMIPQRGKFWLAIPGGRTGVPMPWKTWVERVAVLRKTIVRERYDYHSFPIFIFEIVQP